MKKEKFRWTNQVQLAVKGDPAAWDDLYRATYRNAYFVAVKVVGNEEDAMELVQDAYITAMENLGSLKEPEKFQSWLNMIVANKCRDHLRKKKPMLFSEMGDEDGAEPEWVDDRVDIRPDLVMDQEETVRLVAEIIEALPEDQRLCVTLFYRDELSVSEIAQALEVSEGTVKSRLNYARQKVKAKVEELEKQGVKLYGIAPIPYFIWLLKNSTEDVAIPVRAASISVTGKAAASGSAKSAVVTGAHAGAAVGAKAGAAAVVTKIAACVAVAAILGGGAYMYNQQNDIAQEASSQRNIAETSLIQNEEDIRSLYVTESIREETTVTIFEEQQSNLLDQTLDFSKCWSIPIEIEDGSTPADPTPELPYGNRTYFVCFRFYDGEDLEILFYKPYTDFFYGYNGYYVICHDELELTYYYNGIEYHANYQFQPDKLTLTQLSEIGIVKSNKKGMKFQLVEDPFMDIESMHNLVELSLEYQNDASSYDG